VSSSRSISSFWSTHVEGYLPSFLRSTPTPRQPIVLEDPEYTLFKKHIRGELISHVWDAAAMFFGTLVWMGVYYAQPQFAEMDDDGDWSYALHVLAMGFAANAVVIPFNYFSNTVKGRSAEESISTIKKYFLIYVIPDALYEPTADFLIAISKPDFYNDFDFEKYADSTFEPREIIGAVFLFGISFGMIYYVGDKLICRYFPDPYEQYDDEVKEENLTPQDAYARRVLRVIREILESSEIYALKAALQYFIFYLTDFMFDVDWVEFEATMPQLLGVCGMMSGYSLVLDSFPEILHLIERYLYQPQYNDPDLELASTDIYSIRSSINIDEPSVKREIQDEAKAAEQSENKAEKTPILAPTSRFFSSEGMQDSAFSFKRASLNQKVANKSYGTTQETNGRSISLR
jgi:hypothetical protein